MPKSYVFQINPVKRFKLSKALSDPELGRHGSVLIVSTREHENWLSRGEKIYLWEANPQQGKGLVAKGIVEIDSKLQPMPDWQLKHNVGDYKSNAVRAGIKIQEILKTPVSRAAIENDPVLKSHRLFKKASKNKEGSFTQAVLFDLTDAEEAAIENYFNGKDPNETGFFGDDTKLTVKERKFLRQHLRNEGRANTGKIKKRLGYVCMACGFDFEKFYGPLGVEFIEAHHLEKYSEMGKAERILSEKDFAVLCANCHRMIHRFDHPHDLKAFRNLLKTLISKTDNTKFTKTV